MTSCDGLIQITGRWVGAVALAVGLSAASPSALADMNRSSWDQHGDVASARSPYPSVSATGALWSHGLWDNQFDMAVGQDAYRSDISTTPSNPRDGGLLFTSGLTFFPAQDQRETGGGFAAHVSDQRITPDKSGALDPLGGADEFGVVQPIIPEPTSVLMGGIAALLLTRRPRRRAV